MQLKYYQLFELKLKSQNVLDGIQFELLNLYYNKEQKLTSNYPANLY